MNTTRNKGKKILHALKRKWHHTRTSKTTHGSHPLSQYRALAILLIGGLVLALSLEGLLYFVTAMKEQKEAKVAEEIRAAKTINPFQNISLEAKAVYVLELKTGEVLYAKNENEKFPLASITKLMTALLAREHMSESVTLTLTKDDLAAEGDSGLLSGERWRLGDLLRTMLIISSNDAAHAVAGFVGADGHPENFPDTGVAREHFIQMMNERAKALGYDKMEFFNESGLDVSEFKNGGYGSARNVAQLIAELWKNYPETVEVTARKDARIYSQDNFAHILPNTNEIVGHIPGLIASKTGYTVLAGGNLAVIFDRGMGDPIVVVVLGSSYKGRFDDMQKVVSAATNLEIPAKITRSN